MKHLKFSLFLIFFMVNAPFLLAQTNKTEVGLSLIPPATISNKVDLDIRAGILNQSETIKKYEVCIYINKKTSKNLLYKTVINIPAGSSKELKTIMNTADKVGKNTVIMQVKEGTKQYEVTKNIDILNCKTRSPRLIDGAWAGIYHWSEEEGKLWNPDIKKLTDEQWKDVISSMHKVGMDIVVIQEVFRHQADNKDYSLTVDNYPGKAFYDSKLYPGRMPITANDPLEAILSEADKHGMNVFMGVGLFAWFDFSPQSLEWHKNVAKELWNKYGHHPSFYGFYVSEESGGGLDRWAADVEEGKRRKNEIVTFFKEFKSYCKSFAPSKPIMLATNSLDVPKGADTYPQLLENLDILITFAFARMPESDLTGEQAAKMLQGFCDEAGSHLWFDLEAFLFNKDMSLYPRPMNQIEGDLRLFDNFEKVLCYQYPGMFNDPELPFCIGEKSSIQLFIDYLNYMRRIKSSKCIE